MTEEKKAIFDTDDVFYKSNALIGGKYNVTPLENKIMAIAMSRIENTGGGKNRKLQARLYPGELKHLIGSPSHIYRDLKKVAKTMPGHTIFMEDGKGNFTSFAFITDADYLDGVFIVTFNDKLRPHMFDLKGNYTGLELSILTGFSRNPTMRLYEILKMNAFRLKNAETVAVTYNLSELKFMIGLANGENQRVKNEMARMGADVDWDALYDMLDGRERKYDNWSNFRMRVLDPAKEEMEKSSNIRFEYKGIPHAGKKIGSVRFLLFKNNPQENVNQAILDKQRYIEDNVINSYEQLEIPKDMSSEARQLYDDYVGHNHISKEDIDVFMKKSLFDVSLVRSAIEEADRQAVIHNYIGWIVRCIERGGYSDSKTGVVKGEKDKYDAYVKVSEDVHSPAVAVLVWNKMKNKDDFGRFSAALVEEGLSLEIIEATFDEKQCSQIYTNWKVKRNLLDGI